MKLRYYIFELTDGQQLLAQAAPGIDVLAPMTDSATLARQEELDVTDQEFAKLQKRIVKKPVDFDTLKLKPKRKTG